MTLNPQPPPPIEHRILTVRQPWARAIVDGHKLVENRTAAFTLKYRGPLWIHAGGAWSPRGMTSRLVRDLYRDRYPFDDDEAFPRGAILGRVDVVDAHHHEPGCCTSPWAEETFLDSKGRLRTDPVHLVLENPHRCRPLAASGALGLWRPDPDLAWELDVLAEHLEPAR